MTDSDLTDGARVHTGFNDAMKAMDPGAIAKSISDALSSHEGYSVKAVGHSLGGAVATLTAAKLRKDSGLAVDLYTFGAPRVGNDVLSDFITKQEGGEWRVMHLSDPVPRLPPLFLGYRHISPEYWLSGAESNGDDYPIADVKVCEGNANEDCNESTGALDILDHLTYFGNMYACGSFGNDRRADG